jgi:hypothetical protein
MHLSASPRGLLSGNISIAYNLPVPAHCPAQSPHREVSMFKPDPLADKAGEIFFAKAAPRLEALLKKYEVSDPSELSPALQRQLLQSTVLETAAVNFPETNLEMVKHQFRSFLHSAFVSAMDRMMVSCRGQSDAFDMTRGIYAAVVLAGFSVCRLPLLTCRRHEPSRNRATTLTQS